VLFNIFGGITRCDEVARGLIEAFDRVDVKVPFVVRLDGTNDEEGRRLLSEAALDGVHVEKTMLGAAARVVELAGGSSNGGDPAATTPDTGAASPADVSGTDAVGGEAGGDGTR
jgi:hypothetical protein